MGTEKRLIDANALMKANMYGNTAPATHRTYAEMLIQKSPTVDAVEVVHGRWRKELVKGFRSAFGEVFVCSKCGKRYLIPNMNYCPNCGAKMDGVGNG